MKRAGLLEQLKGVRKLVVGFMFLAFSVWALYLKPPTEFWTHSYFMAGMVILALFVTNFGEYLRGMIEAWRGGGLRRRANGDLRTEKGEEEKEN